MDDGAVAVDGARVAFMVVGEGDPVVLVHSTGGSRLQWMVVAGALAPGYRLIVPDLSGAGETTDDGGPLEVDQLVAQVLGVADHVGADRFHLAGYSLGAAVSIATAAAAADRVRSVAALFGWARSDPVLALQFDVWSRLFRADRSLFVRYLLSVGASDPFIHTDGLDLDQLVELMAVGLAPGTDRHAELDARLDIEDRLSSVAAPTLVVGGRDDRVLPMEHSRRLAAGIPGAELREVDGNHLLFLEDPGLVARLLGEWLATQP